MILAPLESWVPAGLKGGQTGILDSAGTALKSGVKEGRFGCTLTHNC